MQCELRVWARAALIFAAVLLFGAWPSEAKSRAWSRCVSTFSNPWLRTELGRRGAWAQLSPENPGTKRSPSDNVRADTILSIRVRDRSGELQLGMAARRDSFLPAVLFVALVVAAPVPLRRKLLGLAIGLPLICAVAIASIWVLVAYVLAHQAPDLYPTSTAWRAVLDFAFERWLAPPGNRVIAPLLLALAVLAPARRDWDAQLAARARSI